MNGSGRHGGLVTLALTVALATAALAGVPAAEATTTVNDCGIVNDSTVDASRTVLLGSDVSTSSGNCLEVTTGDVTVDGQGNTISQNAADGVGILVGNTSDPVENVTVRNVTVTGFDRGLRLGAPGRDTVTGATVENVTVDGANRGIQLSDADGAVVSNSTFRDGDGDGVAVRSDSDDVVLRNLTLSGNGDDGVSTSADANRTTLRDTTVTDHTGSGAVAAVIRGAGTAVENLTVDGATSGLELSGADPALVEVTVTDTDGVGVLVSGADGASLTDVTVSETGAGGVNATDTTGVTLDNVTVTDTGGVGVETGGDATLTDTLVETTGGSDVGVLVDGNGLRATNLTVRDAGRAGVQAGNRSEPGTADVALTDVTVANTGDTGVHVRGQNLTATGVDVDDVGGRGIRAGRDATVENATVSNTGQQGLDLRRFVTLTNVTVTGAGNTGVDAGDDLTATGVDVDDVGGRGIRAGRDVEVENATVSNTGQQGLSFRRFVTLTNVTVTDAGDIGVDALNDVTATDVVVDGAAERGIFVDRRLVLTDARVTNVSSGFLGATELAYGVDGGETDARNVTVRNVGDGSEDLSAGVTVEAGSTVRNATVRNTSERGFFVQEDTLLTDVSAAEASIGVQGQGGNLTIKGATVTDVTATGTVEFGLEAGTFGAGIVTDGDGLTVRNTTVTDTAGVGIRPSNDTRLVNVSVDDTDGPALNLTSRGGDGVQNVTATDLDVGTAAFDRAAAANVRVDESSAAAAPVLPAGNQSIAHVAVENTSTDDPTYANLTFAYTDGDVVTVLESTVGLYRNDGSGWLRVDGATVDRTNDTVAANLTSFSEVAVFGERDDPPTAALSAPATVETGESVTFDASGSSDPDTDVERYAWDFDGDGVADRTTASPTTTFTYESAGTVTASVTVESNGLFSGAATTTLAVETPATPTPTSTPERGGNGGNRVSYGGDVAVTGIEATSAGRSLGDGDTVTPGETVTVEATVTNDGNAGETRTVGLFAGDRRVAQRTVTLRADETRTLRFSFVPTAAGEVGLRVGSERVGTLVVGDRTATPPDTPTATDAPTDDPTPTATATDATGDDPTPTAGDGPGLGVVAALAALVAAALVALGRRNA